MTSTETNPAWVHHPPYVHPDFRPNPATETQIPGLRPPAQGEANVQIRGLAFQVHGDFDAMNAWFSAPESPRRTNFLILLYEAALRSRQPDGHGYLIVCDAHRVKIPVNAQSDLSWALYSGANDDLLDPGHNFPDPAEAAVPCVYNPDPGEDPDGESRRRGWGPGWHADFDA